MTDLTAAIEALRPFADLVNEGSEDFPDDTKGVIKFGRTTDYSLNLGDLRRAQSALAALERAGKQEGWQTIDKAPKDGTCVLTTNGKNRRIESFPTDPEYERLWAWVSDAPWRPTHFMELPPLPAPPPAEGDE